MEKDNNWQIKIDKFYQGFSPLAFNNSLTEHGSAGNASVMQNADIIGGDYLTQGSALSNLTNGTQAGVVNETIQFIMDKAVAADVSYAIGTSKLFKISSTTVASGGTPSWPISVTNCVEGESIQVLKGNLYYFFNTASAGEIGKYDLSTTFDHDWGSTVPTGAAALQNAPHPSDKKEDILLFGNGRYVGTYITATNTLAPTKLDFGNDAVVDDVLYNGGYWYLAVNSGITGTNRTEGQIYLYDGSATSTLLADETGVGTQRIGFIYKLNGIIYVAYQDLSSAGFIIGYIAGSQIKPLGRFTGTLPNFQQKTLYKNTILFLSSGLIFSAGAIIDSLPFQLSQIADGGYATCGAIAAPFGTPLVASTDGGSNFRLAKFSGYDIACSWKSIIFPLSAGRMKGYIDNIIVLTKSLGASASCALTIEANQAASTSTSQTITGTNKRKHIFKIFGLAGIEDFRIALDWSGGSASNDCAIRSITINGHWVED